jgi:hypothetical protein
LTHAEQVAEWHTERPDWTLAFSAREWDVLERAAEAFDLAMAPVPEDCKLPPQGWYCTRQAGHDGPCAAYLNSGR